MNCSRLLILVICCFLPVPAFQNDVNCTFVNNCHHYGSYWWITHANYCHRCSTGKIYHCARDYDSPDTYREGCAVEKNCSAGHEPHLSFKKSGQIIEDPIVHCRICHDDDYYNGKNRSSSTFSHCPDRKINDCSEGKHKIKCKEENSEEDRFCRCDARNGYWPVNDQSYKMCSYKDYDCNNYDCPPTDAGQPQQRLLNYTCAPYCQKGFERRGEDSDVCVPIPTTGTRLISTTKSPIKPVKNVTASVMNVTVGPVPPETSEKVCAVTCDNHSTCINGTCVCLDSGTCPSVYKPVCGYDSESDQYKTFDTECKLFRIFCIEKKFHWKHHGKCEKEETGLDEKWIILIAGMCCIVLVLALYGLHKSRLGKKCRDKCLSYTDEETPIPVVDGNTSNDETNVRRQLSAPISEPEDSSTPSLRARRDSKPITFINKTENIYHGTVIQAKGGKTHVSVTEDPSSKQGNTKSRYNKDNARHGEDEQLLRDSDSDSDDNFKEQSISADVHFPKPKDTETVENSETDDHGKEKKEEKRDEENEKNEEPKDNNTSQKSDDLTNTSEVSDLPGVSVSNELRKLEADGVEKEQNNQQTSGKTRVDRIRRLSVSHESLLTEQDIKDVKPLFNDMDRYKEMTNKVLDRCLGYLLKCMDPELIITCFKEKEMFEYTSLRDVSEKPNTTEKCKEIIKLVRQSSEQNYNLFKTCLRNTRQSDCLGKLLREQTEVLAELDGQNRYKFSRELSGSVPDRISMRDSTIPDNTYKSSASELPENVEQSRIGVVPLSPESEIQNHGTVGPTFVPAEGQFLEEKEIENEAELSTDEEKPVRFTDEGKAEFSTAEEKAELSTVEEKAGLSTAEKKAVFSTAEGKADLSTAEEKAGLSTAEEKAELSTAEGKADLSTAEEKPDLFTVEEKSMKCLRELSDFLKIDQEGEKISRDKRFEMFVEMCKEMITFIPELNAELFHMQQPVESIQGKMSYRNTPHGFQAYKSSGKDNSCLYQSVSLLLYGSEDLQHSLRMLATLHAVTSFGVYKKQLLLDRPEDLKLFFAHHISDRILKEISEMKDAEAIIDACLKVLMMETAFLGTDSSGLHVDFLCGALGRNIQQYFQQRTEHDHKKVPWIKYFHGETDGEGETLPDLHIFWVNYDNNEKNRMNHIVPLLKRTNDTS